jgi:hypothetical protein
MLCLGVKDQRFTRYIEQSIPKRELTAFVFENLDDEKVAPCCLFGVNCEDVPG